MTTPLTLTALVVHTTGVKPSDRVCELGVATLTLTDAVCGPGRAFRAKVGGVRAVLVDPGRPIPPAAQEVHGVTDAMTRGAPDFNTAWSEIGGAGAIPVVHNLDFAKQFLPLPESAICLFKALARFWPEVQDAYRLSTLNQEAALALPAPIRANTPCPPGPGAGQDAWFTAWALARCAERATVRELQMTTKRPPAIQRLPWGKHRGARFDDTNRVPWSYLDWLARKLDKPDPLTAAVRQAARTELDRRRGAAQRALTKEG